MTFNFSPVNVNIQYICHHIRQLVSSLMIKKSFILHNKYFLLIQHVYYYKKNIVPTLPAICNFSMKLPSRLMYMSSWHQVNCSSVNSFETQQNETFWYPNLNNFLDHWLWKIKFYINLCYHLESKLQHEQKTTLYTMKLWFKMINSTNFVIWLLDLIFQSWWYQFQSNWLLL